jgi:hypothetical protein
MRAPATILLLAIAVTVGGQPLSEYTGHYTFAFIEDSTELVPLRGNYSVEYLARGHWWSYTDPSLPVNYAGRPLALKPLIDVGGATLLAVEPGKDYTSTDQKLRVVRDADTLIVDLSGPSSLEALLQSRTAYLELPPRPPVLLPFRKGWFPVNHLVDDVNNIWLSREFDDLWRAERDTVLVLYDTLRYTFSLETDDHGTGPLEIQIDRDPNYLHHLLRFPASGPGVVYELTRQGESGVPDPSTTQEVTMDPTGETPRWVDITAMPPGKYTVRMRWEENESTFHLLVYGAAR